MLLKVSFSANAGLKLLFSWKALIVVTGFSPLGHLSLKFVNFSVWPSGSEKR